MNTLIQTQLRSLVSVRCERGYLQRESLALRHQGGGFKAISKTDLLRPCGSRLMASVVNLVAHVAARPGNYASRHGPEMEETGHLASLEVAARA